MTNPSRFSKTTNMMSLMFLLIWTYSIKLLKNSSGFIVYWPNQHNMMYSKMISKLQTNSFYIWNECFITLTRFWPGSSKVDLINTHNIMLLFWKGISLINRVTSKNEKPSNVKWVMTDSTRTTSFVDFATPVPEHGLSALGKGSEIYIFVQFWRTHFCIKF